MARVRERLESAKQYDRLALIDSLPDVPFLADVCITPIFDDGQLTGFTKVVQDLTERS